MRNSFSAQSSDGVSRRVWTAYTFSPERSVNETVRVTGADVRVTVRRMYSQPSERYSPFWRMPAVWPSTRFWTVCEFNSLRRLMLGRQICLVYAGAPRVKKTLSPIPSQSAATPPFLDGFPANLRFRSIWALSPPLIAPRVCSRLCPNTYGERGSVRLRSIVCAGIPWQQTMASRRESILFMSGCYRVRSSSTGQWSEPKISLWISVPAMSGRRRSETTK